MGRINHVNIIKLFYNFLMVLLCIYIVIVGVTGKHFSGIDIAAYAQNRITKTIISPASRGEIFSGDGKVIATNVQRYKMYAVVSSSRGEYNGKLTYVADAYETANAIAPIIGMEVSEMAFRLQTAIDDGKYQVEFGNYSSDLSSIVKEEIDSLDISGIEFEEIIKRNYPLGDFASYLIGYAQTEEQDNGRLATSGKMGFELLYDEALAGEDGYRVYQADIDGYILPNGMLEDVQASDGSDLYLTIHSTLQRDLDIELAKLATDANATMASAAIMEAKTGRILAISNVPSFDPNVRELTNYTDYFMKLPYEVGSVFKPFVYASAIEDGVYNGSDTYESGTYMVYDETPVRDWNDGVGFGQISYDLGLSLSSNVAIANLIDRIIDRDSLISHYEDLGFFNESSIDGITSPSGVAGYADTIGKVEFINTGFGQGSTATSLQMLRAYSVFANDGKMVEPYLIDKIVDVENNEASYVGSTTYSQEVFSSETIAYMNDLLYDVINGSQVASTRYKMDDVDLIGKTGTAQVASSSGGYSETVNISSFAGLAPYDDPEIIIYVTMESPTYTPVSTPHGLIGDLTKTMVNNSLAVLETVDDVSSDLLSYELDSYMNQSYDFVSSTLASKGLEVIKVGNGTQVILQDPPAHTVVAVGDKVFIQTDALDYVMPNFIGWSKKNVLAYCVMAGFQVEITGDIGLVVSQDIDPGTILDENDKVTIIVE